MSQAARRNGRGEQPVRETRCAGNIGLAIRHIVQVSLESLCVSLDEVLAVSTLR